MPDHAPQPDPRAPNRDPDRDRLLAADRRGVLVDNTMTHPRRQGILPIPERLSFFPALPALFSLPKRLTSPKPSLASRIFHPIGISP